MLLTSMVVCAAGCTKQDESNNPNNGENNGGGNGVGGGVNQSYSVSVVINPIDGGTVSGSGTYSHGISCTVTAFANIGYTFQKWTENGDQVSTNPTYTFTVTNDRVLTAHFTTNSPYYTISVTANPSDGGSVSGGGSFQQGESCTLTAMTNTGYTFTNWTENDSVVSVYSSTSFVVNSNRSLVANFSNTPPSPPGVHVQNLPYCQSFWYDFGTYMIYDVFGPQSWEIDYSSAKMTGSIGGGICYANQDWLISSPVAITGVGDAKMTMEYVGRYFSSINDEVTVLASTNYTWGDDPTNVSCLWEPLAANLTEGSSWNFQTTEISLTEYVGQTVTFAVKYNSTNSNAGVMEIRSITINGWDVVQPVGNGTASDPYNVAAGICLQNDEPIAWVQGYIVGSVKSGISSVTDNADINWVAPFDLATNVLITDDVACREVSQCIIVNLPAGRPLCAQVNLMDNPSNLGKHLAVNGKLRRYFGQAGLRDSNGTVSDFLLDP